MIPFRFLPLLAFPGIMEEVSSPPSKDHRITIDCRAITQSPKAKRRRAAPRVAILKRRKAPPHKPNPEVSGEARTKKTRAMRDKESMGRRPRSRVPRALQLSRSFYPPTCRRTEANRKDSRDVAFLLHCNIPFFYIKKKSKKESGSLSLATRRTIYPL